MLKTLLSLALAIALGHSALADEARVDAIERRYYALHSSIAAAMDPPVPVLRSEAGIGKTHLLIEEVATAVLFASSVVYAVQKHSNAIAVAISTPETASPSLSLNVCFVTRKSMLTSTQPEWYATDVLSQLLPLPLLAESSA